MFIFPIETAFYLKLSFVQDLYCFSLTSWTIVSLQLPCNIFLLQALRDTQSHACKRKFERSIRIDAVLCVLGNLMASELLVPALLNLLAVPSS
jgi:hypothetical protein